MLRHAMIRVVSAVTVGVFSLITTNRASAQVIEANSVEEVIQPLPEQQWECGVGGPGEALAGTGTVAGGCIPCPPTAWPDGVIPFEFGIAGLNPGYVRSAMDVWNLTDAGIVFVPRTNEPNYIRFVSDDTLFGGSSCVGTVGGAQEFKVHSLLWSIQPLVLHELGHALGQWHEHTRPDRGFFIRVNPGNMDPQGPAQIVTIDPAQCWLTLATPYDFLSILHYRNCAFSACDPCPLNPTCVDGGRTIVVLPGFEGFDLLMGNVLLPSGTDIDDMRNIYGWGVATYVDRLAIIPVGFGTLAQPFQLFAFGVAGVAPGSTLVVREGTYTSPAVIDKPMTIRSYWGPVTLAR